MAIARRFSRLIYQHQSEILDTIQSETHKNRLSAFEETVDAAQLAHFYGRRGAGFLRSGRRRGAIPFLTRAIEHHRPVGVVGVITPWNYPFTLPASDVIPALIAGNAVVLLPDVATPRTADIVERLLLEAGLPKGVLTVIHGGGRVHGDDLVAAADFIMFTGSTTVGRSVAEKCASRLIGFSGELGGKNPMLVLSDADVNAAAKAADAPEERRAARLARLVRSSCAAIVPTPYAINMPYHPDHTRHPMRSDVRTVVFFTQGWVCGPQMNTE
jgi:succinate-semialdehyde dehydrogenase/glutarate-semialdehyde dehydrogenase